MAGPILTQKRADPIAGALVEARKHLGGQPDLAKTMAQRILAAAPQRLEAKLLLGAALRRDNDPAAAIAVLAPLVQANPKAWGLQFELGAAHAALGETDKAIAALSRATSLNPQSSLAWHALGDQLAVKGDSRGAEAAQARPLPGSISDPLLQTGAKALFDGDLATADKILKDRFDLHPTDVVAVRLLADAAMRLGVKDAAEGLLRPVLEAAPNFIPAGHAYAVTLLLRNDHQAALTLLERLLQLAPGAAQSLSLRGAVWLKVGEFEAAAQDFALSLEADPDQPRVWLSYGHALRTLGRQADSVSAYRKSLALEPTLGDAYWSLANLKVVRFTGDDLAAMDAALAKDGVSDDDRAHLHFALGKALEDERRYEESFRHYAQGNALRQVMAPYDWAANRDYVRRTVETFTAEFLAARQGCGDPRPDPIFIVGLPRSGSTLLEQILSCHSQVEGVSELPDLIALATKVSASGDAGAAGDDMRPPGDHYPAMLRDLPPERFAELGAEFLERTRIHRKLGRPFFVDKLPNNFMQLGFLQLILPNAKIIDARRHPMACCFSGFKQNFARGAQYSYSLTDLGRYYTDYLALMSHFDAVSPGRVHRVMYEDLIADPEAEVRRLLAYCGLDFEAACLKFYESKRPVHTASSEQVRRPLFTEGLDQWRHYEAWLSPLRDELEQNLLVI